LAKTKLQKDITSSDMGKIQRGLPKLSTAIAPTAYFAERVQNSLSELADE
jgi:hypothetical protein